MVSSLWLSLCLLCVCMCECVCVLFSWPRWCSRVARGFHPPAKCAWVRLPQRVFVCVFVCVLKDFPPFKFQESNGLTTADCQCESKGLYNRFLVFSILFFAFFWWPLPQWCQICIRGACTDPWSHRFAASWAKKSLWVDGREKSGDFTHKPICMSGWKLYKTLRHLGLNASVVLQGVFSNSSWVSMSGISWRSAPGIE